MEEKAKAPLPKSSRIAIFAMCSIGVASIVFSILSSINFAKSSPKAGLSNWMANCDDNVKLSSLSIPGSHDSGAKHSLADVAGICQDLSIKEQLEGGARFLDIRLKNYKGNLVVYHGEVNQDLSFDNVLDSVYSFLSSHPSETILLSVKEESKASGSSESFDSLMKKKKEKTPKYWTNDSSLGLLGDHRGGIILLSRYSGSSFGVNLYNGWEDMDSGEKENTFDIGTTHIQDFYKVSDIVDKKNEITSAFSFSSANESSLTLNFLSGYMTNGFPPSYSVSVASTIIPWAKETFSSYSSLGITITDFFSSEIGSLIVQRNAL